ncbi:MAG TPA: isocitrate lyase/phosphoenolpyruvate mutase family protein [Candidatus Limnocylindria bacterium]|nr:isocitrate lyase/phosphoenolpyruvate mutase family protein [Candidatus Limnocylindria bacterium]
MTQLAELAVRLRALHHEDAPLILPNAWDVASARAVERAGAMAIATSSSAVAESLGFEDGENAPPDEMFAAIGRIARSVPLPVTADVEGGYGMEAGELVERLVATGAVGMNVEDTDRGGASTLVGIEHQAQRIAAIRHAAESTGVPLVINARIDVYLRDRRPPEETTDEAIERARAYLAAGADCVYPIWLTDADLIAGIVAALHAPLNVLLRPGAPGIAELHRLGVRRISVGGGLMKRAMDSVEADARAVLGGDATRFTA